LTTLYAEERKGKIEAGFTNCNRKLRE